MANTTITLECAGLQVTTRARTLLTDISLQAREGELTALIGPNGAGKSTLLKALMGLIPAEGTIRVAGKALLDYGDEDRARTIAWVPQDSALRTPLSVREVVAQGRFAHLRLSGKLRPQDHGVVNRALEAAAVAHLDSRSWTTLSGGERRRVLIARALATEARILLLDEPTASLDIRHTLRTLALMRDLAKQGYTVVSALHDLEHVLQFADRALLLKDGRAVTDGTPRDVITPPHIREVYGVDMREGSARVFSLPGAEP